MTSSDGEEIVGAVFAGLGLPLTRIVRSDREQRPDFEAVDESGQRFLVEVKTRFDSEEFQSALGGGELAQATPKLDHDNSVAEILKSGARQLEACRTHESDLALICYVLAGFSPQTHAEQLRATLWGTVRVNDVFDHEFAKPCFYLGPAAFLRYRGIDGVLAIEPAKGGIGLYPNRFAVRRIERSSLGYTLARYRAVFTPEQAEEHGDGIVVPFSAEPPGTFRERLRAVQLKTGRRLSPMQSAGFHTAFRVSIEDPS
jgi:hypothetical protein